MYAADAIDMAYEELAISDQSETEIQIEDGQSVYEPLKEIVLIDNDNPYDADMILLRGTTFKCTVLSYKKSNTKFVKYKLVNAIDIHEAENLLDKIQQEIDKNLGENPSQKQIVKQIQRYLAKTYKYDYDSVYADGEKENFVTAYNQDRKIVCTQYASLVYLLCYRYGIDCKTYYGKRHVYNAIRFDGEDKYTLYDFTGTKGALSPKVSKIQAILSSNYRLDRDDESDVIVLKAINDRIDVQTSWTVFDVLDIICVLMLIAVVIISVKVIKARIYYRKQIPKYRGISSVK